MTRAACCLYCVGDGTTCADPDCPCHRLAAARGRGDLTMDDDTIIAAAQARLERNREALGIRNEPAVGPAFPSVFALVRIGNVVPIAEARRRRHAKERLVPVRDLAWDKAQAALGEKIRAWLEGPREA